MNNQLRKQLVEILRCAADCGSIVTAADHIYGDNLHSATLAGKALSAEDEVVDTLSLKTYNHRTDRRMHLLEAAQRLEEKAL